MNKSTRLIITAAALAGLYAGSLATRAYAADDKAGSATEKTDKDKASCKGKDGCKAKDSCKGKDGCKGHASCKGKNDCKGKGGCGSSDNGCKGKNSCKGKGGCGAAAMEKEAPKK